MNWVNVRGRWVLVPGGGRGQILAYYPSTRRDTGRPWEAGDVGALKTPPKTPRVGADPNVVAGGAIVLTVVASVLWSAIELGAIYLAARAGTQSAMRRSGS